MTNFNELAENYLVLCKSQEQERKDLEKKHKIELNTLLEKQHNAMKEINLSSYFQVGDTIALGKVDYMPTIHYTAIYNIIAVGQDYLVVYDTNTFDNELLTMADLLDAKKLYRNGEEITYDGTLHNN